MMSEPTLIRVSLINHSPQQIYDYLSSRYGKIGMKIKPKRAIIGFQNKQKFNLIINECRKVKINGRELELVPISANQENIFRQNGEAQNEKMEKQPPPAQRGLLFLNFKSKNEFQFKIKKYIQEFVELIQGQLLLIIRKSQQKYSQILNNHQKQEEEPKKRQILALTLAIQTRMKLVRKKFEDEMNKFKDSIINFKVSGNIQVIDVDHIFNASNQNPLPQLKLNNIGLTNLKNYNNPLNYPCKRLCALNKDEFIITTARQLNKQTKNGKIMIYDVNETGCKLNHQSDQGSYGLTRWDKLILAGTYDNSILSINLQIEDSLPEFTKLPAINLAHQALFFQLKAVTQKSESLIVSVLGQDQTLRLIQISKEEVIQGIFTTSIEQKHCFSLQSSALGMEIHNENSILVGMGKQIIRFDNQKQSKKSYDAKSNVNKIKKFNPNVYAMACQKKINLLDVRAEKIVQTFVEVQSDIKSLQILPKHTIVYGSKQIGMFDDRQCKIISWRNDTKHNDFISDIIRLNDKIISCDKSGLITSWAIGGLANNN